MSGAFSMHEGDEKCVQIFGLVSLKVRNNLEDLGLDGRIIWEGVDWIHLAQDRGWWWALVNTVMDI
jgi:hypothetical protein